MENKANFSVTGATSCKYFRSFFFSVAEVDDGTLKVLDDREAIRNRKALKALKLPKAASDFIMKLGRDGASLFELERSKIKDPVFLAFCRRFGFKFTPTRNSKSGGIWISEKLGVVLKQPYYVRGHERIPPAAVVTWFAGGGIVVQPIVETIHGGNSARRTEVSNRLDWCKFETMFGYDCHEGNCGIYKGALVAIDW